MRQVIIPVLLVLLLALQVVQYHNANLAREQLADQAATMDALNIRLAELEAQALVQREQLASLERQSVGGVVDGANTAIKDGFHSLMSALELEMQRWREQAEQNSGSGATP